MKFSKIKPHFSYLFLLLLIVGSVFIIKRNSNELEQTDSGNIFGTVFQIKYYSAQNYREEIMRCLQSVDESMSLFNPQSTLSHINNNTSKAVDEQLKAVFLMAEDISTSTGGAFDVTVAPLVNAWGFGFKHDQFPTQAQIDSIKPFVGYQKVKLVDNQIIKEDPRIMIDFGAIAKGYAVDCVARLLDSKGIHDYMVDIGGEVRVSGRKHDNGIKRKWTIGLEKPVENAESLQTVLQLNNESVATSGNYRNFYYRDGKKYAHTISPITGRPVTHTLLSASVIASNCATADALATAFMVMGKTEAVRYIQQHHIKAYLIYEEEGKLKVWENLKGLVAAKNEK